MSTMARTLALAALAASAAAFRGNIRPATALPMIIGHRGLLSKFPENTLISFQAALDAGADGIEGDLHLTQDGVIVMMHDDTLDRTTNCTGMIENHTYAQLQSCNANYASVFGNKYGFVPIPTFDQVIALLAPHDTFMVMDLKEHLLLGQLIAPILAKYNFTSRAIASCWTEAQLIDSATYLPGGPRQMLTTALWGDPIANETLWQTWMSEYNLRGFSIDYTNITQQFVAEAHARLLSVVAWTDDNITSAQQLATWGIDGIITDDADTFVQTFQGLQAAVYAAIMGTGAVSTSTSASSP